MFSPIIIEAHLVLTLLILHNFFKIFDLLHGYILVNFPPRFNNSDIFQRFISSLSNINHLDLLQDQIQPFNDLPKHDMFPIKPIGDSGDDKELRTISIRTSIGH
ncbi:hypothetical protein WICPIJ_004283 [Wickerhamomyces pijperi]|uniref:Uncharacterized protein n=1 Tax=Wickerhamomyces pijperi TaxID=599730 RepID=A0A9P8Q5M4_WICPI|nr:hypothetical protein WICPIJ_004283 [Wickerhamomyces pijperi]